MAVAGTSNSNSNVSSYSYLQYKNKINGLVSGMDIDSIMEKLMKAEHGQMEKLQQQKQKYEWQRDAYRDVNLKLSTFEKDSFTDYGLKNAWNTKTVNASNTAVSGVATATASGTLSVSEATLATAGNKVVEMSSAKLSELGFTETNGKMEYSVDGTTFKNVTFSKDDSVDSLMKKLNATGDFKAELKTDALGQQTLNVSTVNAIEFATDISSTNFANNIGLSGTGQIAANTTATKNLSTPSITANSTMADVMGASSSGSFTIKAVNEQGSYTEKTIEYNATDKVSDVMSRISASGVGVTALVSGNKLSLTANSTGKGAEGAINITSDANGLFNKLGVLTGNTGDVTAGGTAGTDGHIVVNGVKIEGTSNKYTVSGYQLTINKNIANGDAPSNISSTADNTKTVEKVKAFVTSYNELIAELSKKTAEKKDMSFQPLTDAQKSEMTKDEITKWEEKAKSGLLRGDSTLNKVVSDMRDALSEYGRNSSGSSDMLIKIGIDTSKNWVDGGKLEIDEEKLLAALEKDPEIVSRIFTGDSTTGSEGIIATVRKTAQEAVNTIKKNAGSSDSVSDQTYTLGTTISSVDAKITDWKDRLKGIEERYWKQFTAMESAINKANSQASIFAAG